MGTEERITSLIKAFEQDDFTVNRDNDVFTWQDKIGIVATHSMKIGKTEANKKAYYVEGSPHQMGYLMGLMAEPTISRMCTEFTKTALVEFIAKNVPKEIAMVLGSILDDLGNWLAKPIFNAIPPQYKEELDGILDGCKQQRPDTEVNRDALWFLNVGFDALLSFVYTFELPHERVFRIPLKHEYFRIPTMCNGFSVFGKDTAGRDYHYMGRDFMFPTGNVFQDTAAMIIYNPDSGHKFVSMAAPGIIGSMTAMNMNGLGIGVDMAPAGNCNSSQPGFNSLLLNRHVIQQADNLDSAIRIMADAPRGVPWIYLLADGTDGKDKCCVIEAGEKVGKVNFLSYPPACLTSGILNPVKDLLDNPSTPDRGGLMVRMHDYHQPDSYMQLNKPLVDDFAVNHLKYAYAADEDYGYTYNAADFALDGSIDSSWTDRNCPMSHYFAPIRYNPGKFVVTTNHFLIPEMRLCAMAPASNTVAQWDYDNIQWRYDKLSSKLKEALNDNSMSPDKAKEIIDFLSPSREYKDYYNKDGDALDQVQIHGSISVLNLKDKTIESKYGFYSDGWVQISLKNY